ncbi:MAG: InlB B-repeat-containing protein [Treponemataceae bacterium]|nr:InlB B-repeat-containing protein [Treponemataceae bacterium]
MKKTTLFARLLAGTMVVFFLMGGGVSCSDGSDKDNTPETKYYTVMFDSNGGSDVASQKVEEGKLATKPANPKNGDAPFLNWLKDGKSFNFSTPITANITLIAEWGTPGAKIYSITFDSNGGTAIDPQNVESGKTADEPSAPTKDGYIFVGWYNGDNEFDFATPIIDNTALTAKWEAVETPGGEEGDKKPDIPVISGPVAGGVRDLKASNEELETAYITWKAADNAKWYNVYVSPNPATADSWVKLDGPLVREYKDYFRADALGLAAGKYDMKVVPVSGEDKEATEFASEATGITVYAHERAGYAFTDSNVPGAYNMDGTLKTGAQVVYVTASNAKTVTATVNGATVTGFQAILDARQKGGEQPPLCIRIVGTVKASDLDKMSSSAEGLQIKGKSKTQPAENITVEGVGNDGTIKDFGILLRACRNDEIRNLGILNCMDDGVSIDTDNSHLWVHNLDIFYGKGGSGDKAKGDGALDTKNSSLITHSYNHFWDCGKCNLQGMTSEDPDTRITYHHNWYDHSDSRHPRIRTATVHTYNNYFDGNAKYGVGVTLGASAFVENNYFRSTAAMRPMMSSLQGTDAAGEKGTFSGEKGGMIKSFGNKYDCTPSNLKLMTQNNTASDNIDCYEASSRTEKVPDTYKTKSGGTTYNNFDTAADMYTYSVDTPEAAREKVVRYAGRVGGGDLKWEFDNATEDKNYDIIPGLSAKVIGYTGSVVKIGGGTTSTTPGTGGSTGEGSGDKEEEKPPVTPPAPEGAVASLTFTGSTSTPNPVSAGIVFTVSSSGIDFYPNTGKVRVFKGDSSSTITFTTPNSADEYMCTLACFDKGSAATVLVIGGDETITGNIPVGTGKQGTKNDLTGTTGNVTVKLKGNTTYTIKQGNKEFGIVSITITE